jgi:large subunit ribosomal protein L30
MTRLKVTLKRSIIGTTEPQRAAVRGLGLRKIGSSRELANTPAIRGMVKTILHMIDVSEVAASAGSPNEVSNG